jgi:hypothetical protein
MSFTSDELTILQSEQKGYKAADAMSRSMIVNLVLRSFALLEEKVFDNLSKEDKEAMTMVNIYITQSDFPVNLRL